MVTYRFENLNADHTLTTEVTSTVELTLEYDDSQPLAEPTGTQISTDGGSTWMNWTTGQPKTLTIGQVIKLKFLRRSSGTARYTFLDHFEYEGSSYTDEQDITVGNEDATITVYMKVGSGLKFIKSSNGITQMKYRPRLQPDTYINVNNNEVVAFEPSYTQISLVDLTFDNGYVFDKIEIKKDSSVIRTYTTLPAGPIPLPISEEVPLEAYAYDVCCYAKIQQYTITVTQVANCTIVPDTSSYDAGSSPEFTITPAEGYRVTSVIVDGQPVTFVPDEE